jgi:hypothetical protein
MTSSYILPPKTAKHAHTKITSINKSEHLFAHRKSKVSENLTDLPYKVRLQYLVKHN